MQEFFCKTKIFFGADAVSALAQLHIGRIFLVCDPYFEENGMAKAVLDGANCGESRIFSRVKPDPSLHLAAEGAALVRAFAPDAIVALGGGSAMDCAKAMAYFSGQKPLLVAIPTTSGSGSEVTDFAILTHDGVKHPLVDGAIEPDVAILDEKLVTTLPPSLVADGGFDLVSHVMEAYVATGASAFTDLLALHAFRTALRELPRSYRGDTAVRLSIHCCATMAGVAFSHAGLGLCHALSHALGGVFHVPHGRLNAILLPAVIDANATAGCLRYAALARQAGLSSGNDAVALRALKNALLQLRRSLELPTTLAQAGIPPEAVQASADAIIAAALADPCCATNPIAPEQTTVRHVLWEVMGHE